MLPILAAIAIVWAVLLGTAYLARFRLGLSRPASLTAVLVAYAILASLALLWFGLTADAALGAFGMLLPCAAAVGLVLLPRPCLPHPSGRLTPP